MKVIKDREVMVDELELQMVNLQALCIQFFMKTKK
jgi:hypothetical protein